MKKCNRLISHLAFPIDYSIISTNRPTTTKMFNYFVKCCNIISLPFYSLFVTVRSTQKNTVLGMATSMFTSGGPARHCGFKRI